MAEGEGTQEVLPDDVSWIRWFTKYLRGKTLDQVSRDMIDRLISRHFARKSDRTKDLYVALIRAIFRKAMREWIAHVPAFKTYARSGRVRVRFLTHDQAAELMGRLPEHQREVVLFSLSTGLRQGNILHLRWDQVDMTRRIVTIGYGETKNGEALGVPLNEGALGVLRRQKGKHPVHVFTFRGKRLANANTRTWRAALKACGIENFRWHDLRHTWATWLRQNDVPTWVLQELGGMEIGIDGAALCAHVGEASPALCRPADFTGHRRLINPVTDTKKSNCPEKLKVSGHKNGHSESRPRIKLVTVHDVNSWL
ncbi:site-specific integrase [Novosphingobium sp. RD2P27]|uniref:Site-specific integrase n=1 Tax=Novosphingobium kalidii TaxID=3230299 RepID=A0ABV2D2I3_9SPHN